ncbi:MAG: tetratricopeptide repeat protein [Bacteroidales bacterium]
MRKYILIISCVLLFFISGKAQDLDMTYRYAHKQMQIGNYDNAIAAYRRVLFFDSANQYNERAYFHVARCYKKAGELDKAHYFYDLAFNTVEQDSMKNEVILNKTFLYILQEQANFAMMELAGMQDSLSERFRKEKYFYNGIIHFQTEKFDQSKQYFQKALNEDGNFPVSKLDSLFNELEKINKRNPKLTRYLSLFLPGLGQLYAGYPKEAINSFMLSTASWGLYFYTLNQYTLFDAVLSIYPWFHRYYLGGHARAGMLAMQKIQQERDQIFVELLDIFKEKNIH